MLSLFRTSSAIQRDVERAIRSDHLIQDPDQFSVFVENGVVTLIGTAKWYAESFSAENAAKQVSGVKQVVNNIQLKRADQRGDFEIAKDVRLILEHELPVISKRINVNVRQGILTLEGDLAFDYQRDRAERIGRGVPGVKAVRNNISLTRSWERKGAERMTRGGIQTNLSA
jgi:osmotically-inducible protein OsmY